VKIDDWVIDADTHITEPGDVWADRVPRRFRDRIPRIVRNEQGVDFWKFGDSERVIPIGHTAVAGWPEPIPSAPRNMDEIPPAAYDAAARLAYMDEVGIWAAALYPNIGGFGNETFLGLKDPELMLACVQAYNDWLLDWVAPDPRRFIPIMAIPFWDVEATAAEIPRCAKRGHRGILFTGAPQDFGFPYLGSDHWNPLWRAAQDAGLPVSFHLGSGDISEEFPMDRIRAHGIAPTVVTQTVALFLKTAIQMVDFIMSGVLPRNPQLKVVSVESGIGWMPFALESMDYCFDYTKARRERPEYELAPSEYFRRQVYGCVFHEEFAPGRLLDTIGADNVMFETDYPHPVCLYGNVREKIDAGLGGQSEAVRHKVLWQNAADLYGVGAPDRPWRQR
jgi:predicted TIM-barrel fold metal-dependent hydrolase